MASQRNTVPKIPMKSFNNKQAEFTPSVNAQPLVESQEDAYSPKFPKQRRYSNLLIFITVSLLIAGAGMGILIWNLVSHQQTDQLSVSGRIEGYETDIGAKVAGRIQSVTAREGDEVHQNQVIVKLDDAEIQAQLKGTSARLDSTQKQEEQAKLQINLLESQILESQLTLQQSKEMPKVGFFRLSRQLLHLKRS